jgi:hypothetical protein
LQITSGNLLDTHRLQGGTRKKLVADLQGICSNCENAYTAVLVRLVPVKNAFTNHASLATELRNFAADAKIRSQFKPYHLCGQIDHLLTDLSNNLNPLKYAVDFRRIEGLRSSLSQFGDFDGAIYTSYDEFAAQLDKIATQIRDPTFDTYERSNYARRLSKISKTSCARQCGACRR